MAPPYERSYDYFRFDAEAYIQTHRPTWTVGTSINLSRYSALTDVYSADDRKRTIATIWAGSRVAKTHYAHCKGRRRANPLGLPAANPIPAAPHTQADLVHARGSGTMPIPIPAVPVMVAAPPQTHDIGTQVEGSGDGLPYDFWPRLPWPAEPTLPHVDLKRIKVLEDGHKDVWLGSRPRLLSEEEETAWHGVRVLGAGGYGAASLWVQSDATNQISNVRQLILPAASDQGKREADSSLRIW